METTHTTPIERSTESPKTVDRSAALRISINSSPARKHFVIDSPQSPAKSVTGAIIDDPTFYKDTGQDIISPLLRAGKVSARMDEPTYENGGSGMKGYPADFFDSDSSEVEGGILNIYHERHHGGDVYKNPLKQLPAHLNPKKGNIDYTEDAQDTGLGIKLGIEGYENNTHQAAGILWENNSGLELPQALDMEAQPHQDADGPSENRRPSSETWIPTQGLPITLDSNFYARPSSGTVLKDFNMEDRILKLYRMTLDAITRDPTRYSEPEPLYFDPAAFDMYSNDFRCDSQPRKGGQSVSNHDSFVTNEINNRNLESERPVSVSKQAYIPPIPPIPPSYLQERHPPTKSTNNRSLSSPPAINREVQKHIHIAPPPIPVRTHEGHQFHGTKTLTPFPRAVSAPEATAANAPLSQHPFNAHLRDRSPPPPQTQAKRYSAQDSIRTSRISSNPEQSSGAELVVFLRRRSAPQGYRATSIVIPYDFDVANPRSPTAIGKNEKHFLSLDFDDCMLFEQLRTQYYHSLIANSASAGLLLRFGSARTLSNIRIWNPKVSTGPSFDQANSSETELFRVFQKPKRGKGKYFWVHWAQGSMKPQDPGDSNDKKKSTMPRTSTTNGTDEKATDSSDWIEAAPKPCSLEFLECWSLWRILVAFLVVILASIAICVCWVFLGPSFETSNISNRQKGTQHPLLSLERSERIVPGCIMGVVVFLTGSAGAGAWMWLSFLAM